MLFQGEEWGASSPFQYFTAYDDPVLGQAVADGRREEFAAFGWQPHEGNASQTQVPVMILAREWEEIFQGEAKAALETLLPEYLQQWRWFGGKAREIRATVITEVVRFPYDASVAYWAFVSVEYGEGEPEPMSSR